jgi:hypothetical protein
VAGGTHIAFGDDYIAAWHGDGKWSADVLLETGTLTARCANDVAFMQLHHGNRRVSLEEAEKLVEVGK